MRDYWFRFGTPTYLIHLLNHAGEGLDELTGKCYDSAGFVMLVAFDYLSTDTAKIRSALMGMVTVLQNGASECCMGLLTAFLSDVPYSLCRKNDGRESERYFHLTFNLILRLMSLCTVYAEKESNRRRLDCVVETDGHVYIFEFKLDGSAEAALYQINERGHAVPTGLANASCTRWA